MKTIILFILTALIISPLLTCQDEQNANQSSDLKESIMTNIYQDVRIKAFPFAMQCYTFKKFSFFETLDKVQELGIRYLQAWPGQQLYADQKDLKFDYHISADDINRVKTGLAAHHIKLVAYGVVNFADADIDMRRLFDFAKSLGIETIIAEPKVDDYALLEKLVKEYDIRIAVHNHASPSKYAYPDTVLKYVRTLDSRIGSCADTGHWLRTSVVPVQALQLLKGRIIDVHLKDLNSFGVKDTLDVPFGQGKANIHDILAELSLQNYHGYLTIEHENKDEIDNPSPAIRKGMEFIRGITYYDETFHELLAYANGRYSKHGWNHYGPGYFDLDKESGVLKSEDGMGLFWYSEKKYRDFVLAIDFKCSEKVTNSGVFVRVPEMPTSDDYIFHSFEIQINDAGEGIHKTGAVYDAEAPVKDASRPVNEWNHFLITFKGDHIRVELNDQLIVDWNAEPRGKVKDFAGEGFIGLQNHDSIAPVYFRNIYLKEL